MFNIEFSQSKHLTFQFLACTDENDSNTLFHLGDIKMYTVAFEQFINLVIPFINDHVM
jgi:hypothetical protein